MIRTLLTALSAAGAALSPRALRLGSCHVLFFYPRFGAHPLQVTADRKIGRAHV